MLFTLLVASLCFFSSSCGGDDDGGTKPCSIAYADELQDELNTLNAAAQAYASKPATTTCNTYKNAAQAYVNALEP